MFDGYEWNDNNDAWLDLSSMKHFSFTNYTMIPLQCTFRARPYLYNSKFPHTMRLRMRVKTWTAITSRRRMIWRVRRISRRAIGLRAISWPLGC
jgi:hypothetical protein